MNARDLQPLEGTTQTGLNSGHIETSGSEVAEDLDGHLNFPDVRGSAHQVRSDEDKCGEKRQGPNWGELPKRSASRAPAGRERAWNHQEPHRANLASTV